ASGCIQQQPGNSLGSDTDYYNGTVSPHRFHLPDGSIVTVMTNTRIKTSKEYGRDNREITLNGEALFDVKDTAGLPVIIHTRNLVIQGLGSKFHVDAC